MKEILNKYCYSVCIVPQVLSQMKAKLLGELPKELPIDDSQIGNILRNRGYNICLSQVKEIIEREFK